MSQVQTLDEDDLVDDLPDVEEQINKGTGSIRASGELGDSERSKQVHDITSRSPKRLKDLHHPVDSLRTAGYTSANMKEALVSPTLHHGLESLPDEVFTRIIACIYAEIKAEHGYKATRVLVNQLSSISRRFRTVILTTAWIWTNIDNKYCTEYGFEERIARSKNAPLSLDINLKRMRGDRWLTILGCILPFKDRWRHARIVFDGNSSDVAGRFQCVKFPHLETAILWFDPNELPDKLFAEWTFPTVKKLTLHNAIPVRGLFCSLTKLEVMTDFLRADVGTNLVRRLTDFLTDARQLEGLSIDLSNLQKASYTEFPAIELPNLTLFSISTYRRRVRPRRNPILASILGRVIRSFRIPALKDFRLGVDFLRGGSIIDWISANSSMTDRFQHVSSLSFGAAFRPDETSVTRFFELFPNVQHLDIDIVGFASTLKRFRNKLNLQRLRSLVLTEIDKDYDWDMLTPHHRDVLVSYATLGRRPLRADDWGRSYEYDCCSDCG